MVDFYLSEEQIALQRMTREFVNKEIKPVAAERDRIQDPHERFPWDIVEKASKLGLRTLAIPEELGGGGADILTLAIVGEELAVGDLGVGVIFDQTWKFSYMLSELMNDEQRSRWLPVFMNDHRCILAKGATEPNHGSDNAGVAMGPSMGLQLSAKKDGEYWVLNGMKHFISNGGVASIYFISARTDKTVGIDKGVTGFIVGKDTPGFSIGNIHDKMGQRLIQNAELIFENCRIHERDVLGEPNLAFQLQKDLAKASHVQAAATVLGPARRAYEETVEYAKNRIQGGKPIIEHQAVALMLTEMYMLIEASRNYIWRAAWQNQTIEPLDPKYSAMTKVFVSEASFKVCHLAMEIWGGMGYMTEAPIEKCLRDAASFFHSDGTNQMQRLKAAKLF
jgi:alkylation response protein AidB-like acyl-CoA dehydrogenase